MSKKSSMRLVKYLFLLTYLLSDTKGTLKSFEVPLVFGIVPGIKSPVLLVETCLLLSARGIAAG